MEVKEKQRIIQEFVPGKQITLAHVIAGPDPAIYVKLGLEPEQMDAIGILTITPSEGAIIAADIATKASDITLGFIDRFSGALVFVAHDRVFMDNVGTHVLYLGLSKPVFRKATYTQFLTLQDEYNAQREREARALKDDLDRKMAFVERFRAKATKARQAGISAGPKLRIQKRLFCLLRIWNFILAMAKPCGRP